MLDFLSIITEKIPVQNINVFIVNVILAAVLFVMGIFLGKFIAWVLRKTIEKANLERTVRKSFIELFVTIIKWSIYILFINLALQQLGIPQLTDWLINILVVIPALVGALILIAVGFAISVYLKDNLHNCKKFIMLVLILSAKALLNLPKSQLTFFSHTIMWYNRHD